jgi:hypothetical protein
MKKNYHQETRFYRFPEGTLLAPREGRYSLSVFLFVLKILDTHYHMMI